MRTMKRKPTSLATFLWEDYLKHLGLTPHDLALSLGISNEQMQAILEKDTPIDEDLSQQLGDYFGVDETFFFRVDQKYQQYKGIKYV